MKLRKIVLPIMCAGLVGLLATACDNNKKDKNRVIDTNALLQSGKTVEETSENLALAGEQLLSPISFMYSDIVFDLALRANPENKRAQFLKTLIKPMMVMKGALNRIRPVIDTLSAEQQKEFNDFIAKSPESAMKTFLLDGPQDISTEEDALKFLDGYRNAWEEVRIYMKNNKDLNLDINIMTLEGASAAMDKVSKECQASQQAEGVYSVQENCDYLKALKVNVSRADVEVIQQYAAGVQIYLTLGSSYSLDGLRDFSEKNKDKDLTTQEVIEHFKNSTSAGKLRNNSLTALPEMGLDAIAGARWALSIQNELCASGQTSKKYEQQNRKGFLVEGGLCISQNDKEGKPTEELLKTIEAVLVGGIRNAEHINLNQEIVTAAIKPIAPISSPIKDLRSIAPTSYNECGNAVALRDSSVGGLFVNNDGNSYLKAIGNLDKKNCE